MNRLLMNAGMQPNRQDHERERKTQARKHLIEAFTALYFHRREERLRWEGTKTDLLEALHLIYIYGEMRDGTGRPVRFTLLVRFYFDFFRLQPPANPHALLRNASLRKNRLQSAFLDRYCRQLFDMKNNNPLSLWVKEERDGETSESGRQADK